MTRALSFAHAITIFALATTLLMWASVAEAAPKALSVLGLEVDGTSVTQQATDAAGRGDQGAAQSRGSAERVGGVHADRVDAQKELLDQKLVFNCQAETPPCLVKIANDLHAEVLLFGSLELAGTHIVVTLKLFDASANAGTGKFLKVLKNQKIDLADLQGEPGHADVRAQAVRGHHRRERERPADAQDRELRQRHRPGQRQACAALYVGTDHGDRARG